MAFFPEWSSICIGISFSLRKVMMRKRNSVSSHTYTHKRTHTQTDTHTHTETQTQTDICRHTRTHTNTHHTYAHKLCIHTCTQKNTYTHTHTHTQAYTSPCTLAEVRLNGLISIFEITFVSFLNFLTSSIVIGRNHVRKPV